MSDWPDTIQEAARSALLSLMQGISEEYWRAGWMSGLETACWEIACGRRTKYGMGSASPELATTLHGLHILAGGWWIFEGEPKFLTTAQWFARPSLSRGGGR